jgi:hypothetical protein
MQPNSIVIPDHSHYKGINDRFALAPPPVARLYGQRLQFTLNLCQTVPIHAELYAKLWAEWHQVSVVRMPRFDFFRVRATGVVAAGDAVTLRGCNMTEMYSFPVPKEYVSMVAAHRQRSFGESSGWAEHAKLL